MTNEAAEKARGHIAVWLSPDDIRWLARHIAGIEDDNEIERLGRLHFRLLSALHKAGLPNNIWDSEEE
jgi:hypothetical protein